MIRIGSTWHYEPLKGDIGGLELIRESRRRGGKLDFETLRGMTPEQKIDLAVFYFGKHPVPVPSHILITVR